MYFMEKMKKLCKKTLKSQKTLAFQDYLQYNKKVEYIDKIKKWRDDNGRWY